MVEGGADLNLPNVDGAAALDLLVVGVANARENIELIRFLLERGASPDHPARRVGGNELAWAPPLYRIVTSTGFSVEEKAELIALFGGFKANPDTPDGGGATPLYALAVNSFKVPGSAQLMRALLDIGADPDLPATGGLVREIEGKYIPISELPFTALLRSQSYVREEKSGLLRLLLEHGADLNALGENEYSLFQSLVATSNLVGYLDLVGLALRVGADPLHLNQWGQSALQTACNLREEMQRNGVEVTDVLQLFFSAGVDLNATDGKGRTLLFDAAARRQTDLVSWLLSKGVLLGIRDTAGNTALHALFESSAPIPAELARLLTGQSADLNARGSDGSTALFLAAEHDAHNGMVQLLVEKGADINLANEDEVTPLGIATQVGAKQNAAFLKSKGGVPYRSLYPAGNEAAACRAVLSGDPAAIAAVPVQDLGKMVARTSSGVPATPLHLAVEQGSAKVVESACKRKVDWNVGDRYGRSPLQLAVQAGRADLVSLLLAAGADPSLADAWGATAFSRASSLQPEIARLMLARGFLPKDSGPAVSAIWTGRLDLVKAYRESTEWGPGALGLAAAAGQVEIARFLRTFIEDETTSSDQIAERASQSRKSFEVYRDQAKQPLPTPTKPSGISSKRGTFTWIVDSWSPWKVVKTDKKLEDYPVGVYVPKDYDGTKPFGLLVSMIHAQSSNQFPRPEFQKILDKYDILWVGFDPYNGIFDGFEETHEAFCLAIVYNMLGSFSVDRSRIYMAGFSWGGRLTGEIVPKHPRIFSGGIAIGGCFTTSQRVVPGLEYGRDRVTMVMATGDFDYNRRETYGGYSVLLSMGYKDCHFIQEPLKGHAIMSAASFEKAIRLLDAGR